jgi:CYTH domain-containing protein
MQGICTRRFRGKTLGIRGFHPEKLAIHHQVAGGIRHDILLSSSQTDTFIIMGIEIERKFLVDPDGTWNQAERHLHCHQGYISSLAPCSMRVRLLGGRGYLTMKSKRDGIQREEFEYEIPAEDASHMLEHFCDAGLIEKTRYYTRHEGMLWEVDVFEGANKGLILAEIELESTDQEIILPEWVLKEVSGDPRYFNAMLANHPYSTWLG